MTGRRSIYAEPLTYTAVCQLTTKDKKRFQRLLKEKEVRFASRYIRDLVLIDMLKHEEAKKKAKRVE